MRPLIGDRYTLPCGHVGRVIYRHGTTIAVRGYTKHRCDVCSSPRDLGHKDTTNNRVPTIHLIDVEGGE